MARKAKRRDSAHEPTADNRHIEMQMRVNLAGQYIVALYHYVISPVQNRISVTFSVASNIARAPRSVK